LSSGLGPKKSFQLSAFSYQLSAFSYQRFVFALWLMADG